MNADTLRRLPPAVIEAAVDGVLADALPVFEHVLADSAYPWNWRLAVLADCLRQPVFPPLDVVERIVSWAVFELTWRASFRRLSPRERRVLASARRLWDAREGVPLG